MPSFGRAKFFLFSSPCSSDFFGAQWSDQPIQEDASYSILEYAKGQKEEIWQGWTRYCGVLHKKLIRFLSNSYKYKLRFKRSYLGGGVSQSSKIEKENTCHIMDVANDKMYMRWESVAVIRQVVATEYMIVQ